jgi:hypothetical protein
MTTHDELTREGSRKLAEFFTACLRFGWKREALDFLESLWLADHDSNGKVSTPTPSATTGRPT